MVEPVAKNTESWEFMRNARLLPLPCFAAGTDSRIALRPFRFRLRIQHSAERWPCPLIAATLTGLQYASNVRFQDCNLHKHSVPRSPTAISGTI